MASCQTLPKASIAAMALMACTASFAASSPPSQRHLPQRPTLAHTEPLQAIVQITFPDDSQTIGQALEYVLVRTGYSLGMATSSTQERIRSLPLPESQRVLGPYSVEQILRALVGSEWQLVVNRMGRVVSFVEPPSPAVPFVSPLPEPARPNVLAAPRTQPAAAPTSDSSAGQALALPSLRLDRACANCAADAAVPTSPPLPAAAPAAVTVLADAPPVLPVLPTQQWEVQLSDINLHSTFQRWAKKAGYRVKWDASKHVLIGAPDVYESNFEDAVTATLSTPGIQYSEYPLEACIYPNNPPLVRITRRGEQDKECQ